MTTGEATKIYRIHDQLTLSQVRSQARTLQPQQPQPSHLAICSILIVHSPSLHRLQRFPNSRTRVTPRPFSLTRGSSLVSLSTPLAVSKFTRKPFRPWQTRTHPHPSEMTSYSQHSSSPTRTTQLYFSPKPRSGGTNISSPMRRVPWVGTTRLPHFLSFSPSS